MGYIKLAKFPGYYLDDESEPLMVGSHLLMRKVYEKIGSYKNSDGNVLIVGKTGTGKGLVADALHIDSIRKDDDYRIVEMTTIPSNLLESELFGAIKGAYTNAVNKKGLLEGINGTVFLDEIGELPIDIQGKLLRAIEAKKARKVGGISEYNLNVRFIMATSTPREQLRNSDMFKEALFYRLNTFPINVPSLRERGGDIDLLIKYFSKEYNKKQGKDVKFDDDAKTMLYNYDWPGNVRELSSIVQRLVTSYDVVNRRALEMEDEFSGRFDRPYEVRGGSSPPPKTEISDQDDIQEGFAANEKRLMESDIPDSTGSGSKTYSVTLSDDLIDLIGSSKENIADRISNLIRGGEDPKYKELELRFEEIASYRKELLEKISTGGRKHTEAINKLKDFYTKETEELQEFVQSYVMGDHPSRKDFNKFRDEIKGHMSEIDGLNEKIGKIIDKHEHLRSEIDALKNYNEKIENHLFPYRGKLRKRKMEKKLGVTEWSRLFALESNSIHDTINKARKRGMTIDVIGGISAPQLIEILNSGKRIPGDIIDKIKKYLDSDFDAAFLRDKVMYKWANIIGIDQPTLTHYRKESGFMPGKKGSKNPISPEEMIGFLTQMSEKKPHCVKAIIKLSKYMESIDDIIFTPEVAKENYKRNS